jgi:hypothetical protein
MAIIRLLKYLLTAGALIRIEGRYPGHPDAGPLRYVECVGEIVD